jgi:hypothetical protein
MIEAGNVKRGRGGGLRLGIDSTRDVVCDAVGEELAPVPPDQILSSGLKIFLTGETADDEEAPQLSKDTIYNISDNGSVVEQARMIAGHDNDA